MTEQQSTRTLSELHHQRGVLEDGACLALGRLVMAFSRMDMELGLALVWFNEGKDLENRTKRFEVSTFHAKLAELERRVLEQPIGDSRGRYDEWIVGAHALRGIRNELMHGRWGLSPTTNTVVNVLGLPTSCGQSEVHYTLEQLSAFVTNITALRDSLQALLKEFPL